MLPELFLCRIRTLRVLGTGFSSLKSGKRQAGQEKQSPEAFREGRAKNTRTEEKFYKSGKIEICTDQ